MDVGYFWLLIFKALGFMDNIILDLIICIINYYIWCTISRQISKMAFSFSAWYHRHLCLGELGIIGYGKQKGYSLLVFDASFSTANQSFTRFRNAKAAHFVLLKKYQCLEVKNICI